MHKQLIQLNIFKKYNKKLCRKPKFFFGPTSPKKGASQVTVVVKNPPANAVDIRGIGSIPGSGRSPGKGNGNPLKYSCLENFMDRGAWWAKVYRVIKSQT